MVETAVVAPVVMGSWDCPGGYGALVCHQAELAEGVRCDGESGLLPFAFQREEKKCLVLFHGAADGSAELLAQERWLRLVALVREIIVCLEGVATVLIEQGAVQTVRAALGDDAHRGALATAVGGREPRCGDV